MHVKKALALVAVSLAAAALPAAAQQWPTKPVRVVIPNAAGSVAEAFFRTLAPVVEAKLGQRFVIENKPGAAGLIGTQDIIRSAPDGYSFLLAPTANYAVTPHLLKEHNYDTLAVLEPVSMIADAPLITVVNTHVPAKTLKELVTFVRNNRGKYNFGSPGTGSPAHLTGELFSQLAGDGLVHVAYKGTVPMVQGLLANDVQLAFPSLTGVLGQIRGGKLRALAVMGKERMGEIGDVPTTVEAGFPELIAGNWWVLSAPKGISPTIIDRLYAELKAALALPEVRKKIHAVGHVPVGLSPKETVEFIRSESERYKAVIRKANIKVE